VGSGAPLTEESAIANWLFSRGHSLNDFLSTPIDNEGPYSASLLFSFLLGLEGMTHLPPQALFAYEERPEVEALA